jgi:Spy/CpxP family protein refolding chaperone
MRHHLGATHICGQKRNFQSEIQNLPHYLVRQNRFGGFHSVHWHHSPARGLELVETSRWRVHWHHTRQRRAQTEATIQQHTFATLVIIHHVVLF